MLFLLLHILLIECLLRFSNFRLYVKFFSRHILPIISSHLYLLKCLVVLLLSIFLIKIEINLILEPLNVSSSVILQIRRDISVIFLSQRNSIILWMLLSQKNSLIIPKPTFRGRVRIQKNFGFGILNHLLLLSFLLLLVQSLISLKIDQIYNLVQNLMSLKNQSNLQPLSIPSTINNKELIVYSRRKKDQELTTNHEAEPNSIPKETQKR